MKITSNDALKTLQAFNEYKEDTISLKFLDIIKEDLEVLENIQKIYAKYKLGKCNKDTALELIGEWLKYDE